MLDIKDLRVGNFVINKLNGNKFEITEIVFTGCYYLNFETIIHKLEDCEGIELTKDILLKINFEEFDKGVLGIQIGNNINLYYDEKDAPQWHISYQWNPDAFNLHLWRCPKYLHDIQNLYYSLTGQEFNI